MGKSYTSTKNNNLNIKEIFDELVNSNAQITETTEEQLLNKSLRNFKELNNIININIGCDGTKNSIIELTDERFIQVNKTLFN